MKKLIYILSIAYFGMIQIGYSQQIGNLDGIYYQAVALDDDPKEIVGIDVEAKPLFNREIRVRFTITKDLDGEIQWEETHTTTTDKYGLFTLIIGKGQVTSNLYTRLLDIPWIDADQFLKVEISTKSDGNYIIVSNQKFMTVPYAFYTDDIADDAITTQKILNEEVIAEDIAVGAVETAEILNETILAEDIGSGSVETSEILNETILAEDIAIGAIETSEINNGTILNEDIANGTIDLSTKIQNVSPKQILIGDTTASAPPKLKSLVGGTGITIFQNADSVIIKSTLGSGGVESNSNLTVNMPATLNAGDFWKSNVLNVTLTNGEIANVGDLVLASIDKPLDGCILTAYIHGIQGNKVQVRISVYNPPGNTSVSFGNAINVKFLIVK